MQRRSGILLHPTSLPGPHGMGELGDHALRWCDFLEAGGQRVWQVLPLGPTGYGDSPYQSFSSFAGNPYLISLERLREEGLLSEHDLAAGADLPNARVDFGPVIAFRVRMLTLAAATWFADAGASERAAFAEFRERAGAELEDFALFMALKEAHGGQPWNAWPAPLRQRDPAALAAARAELRAAIDRQILWQWWFERQWAVVRGVARDRGIRVVGDIPIFVAFDSADVWAAQHLFHLDRDGQPTVVAGVPPDYFSATGQRWGNPLYRWDAHRADGFAWWIARVRRTLAWVDELRIDHFRGFEAYWEIPASEPTAVRGRWLPGPGQALFDALQGALAGEASLPILAEDLGVITPAVEALRDQNGLPGMKVLQFAFAGNGSDPYLPHNHTHNAIVYTGTHDNDTTSGWFAQASERERRHVRRYLGREVDHRGGEGNVAWALWRLALSSVAHTAIAPLQDLLGLDSRTRMNTPGAASGNWGWRFAWDDIPAGLAAAVRESTALFGRLDDAPAPDTVYRQSTLEADA
jgi:4-alpha-glucanotransferase